MKKLCRRIGVLLVLPVLFFGFFFSHQVLAISTSVSIVKTSGPDPATGVVTVGFTVSWDEPAVVSGAVMVEGGTIKGLSVPGCQVAGNIFIDNSGTVLSLSGTVQIAPAGASDIKVRVEGGASPLQNPDSEVPVYGSATFPVTSPSESASEPSEQSSDETSGGSGEETSDETSQGSGEETTDKPAETQSSESATQPAGSSGGDHSAEDAAARERIRQEELSRAASESAANEERARQARAVDESRMKEAAEKEKADAGKAGIPDPEDEEDVELSGEGRTDEEEESEDIFGKTKGERESSSGTKKAQNTEKTADEKAEASDDRVTPSSASVQDQNETGAFLGLQTDKMTQLDKLLFLLAGLAVLTSVVSLGIGIAKIVNRQNDDDDFDWD